MGEQLSPVQCGPISNSINIPGNAIQVGDCRIGGVVNVTGSTRQRGLCISSSVQCGWPENTVQPGHSVGISIPSSTTQHIYLHFRIQGRTEFQHCWTGGSDRYDHRIECHMRHCSWLVGCFVPLGTDRFNSRAWPKQNTHLHWGVSSILFYSTQFGYYMAGLVLCASTQQSM